MSSLFLFNYRFTFEENNEARQLLATGQNIHDFRKVCVIIKDKYKDYHEGNLNFDDCENITRQGYNLILPPWICQPYVRMSPEAHTQKMESLSKVQVYPGIIIIPILRAYSENQPPVFFYTYFLQGFLNQVIEECLKKNIRYIFL